MTGHALLRTGGPEALAGWDRPIALGFGIGSFCFLIGPFPGVAQLVGPGPDAAIFFLGSLFFTFAAGVEARQATLRRGLRWGTDATWWSAAIQFVGTLLFNISTFDATRTGFTLEQENRLIWAPDAVGSACFLASGLLAFGVARRAAGHDRAWWMAAINLAGCVFFGISAIASYFVPATGTTLDLAAANWTTSLGAACFLAGAVLLWPTASRRPQEVPT